MLPSARHRSADSSTLAKLPRRQWLVALAALLLVGYTLNLTQFGSLNRGRSEELQSVFTLAAEEVLEEPQRSKCYEDRDYGMIPKLRESVKSFCDDATGVDPALGPLSTFQYYYTPGSDIRGTVVTNLWIDLRRATVHRPIKKLSEDGGNHDPRLKYGSVGVHCTCNANQDRNTSGMPVVWEWMFGEHPSEKQPWRFCHAFKSKQAQETLALGFTKNKKLGEQLQQWRGGKDKQATPHPSGWPYPIHHVKNNAILMGRRDDHNPFFMIGAAMHSWIMMKVLDWSPATTQLVYLDDAIPAETDELQRLMLAPQLPVVTGREIFGSVLRFDRAIVAPFEFWGPLMRNLGSDEPCRRNAMIQDFRNELMAHFQVDREKKDPRSCTVTIISRRPYKGRNVQRKWLNEAAIVDRMVDEYKSLYRFGECQFQALDFVNLSLEQQMRVVVESDLIIGMHGAGMVNLMWARPETVVVEIFPKNRHRWGYKNMCFFIGCKWHQFRGGKDTGKGNGDNSSDKLIAYADWFPFFNPIMRATVKALEERVAKSSWWR